MTQRSGTAQLFSEIRERAEHAIEGEFWDDYSSREALPDLLRALDALDESFALLKEAYPGDSPTNRWRQRVEDLGAWPVRS